REALPAQLHAAGRAQHPAAHDVPGAGAESRSGHRMSTPLLAARWGYASITDKISDIVLHRPMHWVWALGFGIAGTLTLVFFGCAGWLLAVGIGIWGNNIPVAWG